MTSDYVILSEDQRVELSRIAQSRSLPAGYVFRAKLILMRKRPWPASAAVTQLVDSPPCYSSFGGSTNFCNFQTFAFVTPGVYDITFSYNLGNGTQDASAKIEYVVSGPTNSPNCVMNDISCAFSPVLGSLRIEILSPGQNVQRTILQQYTMYSGDPIHYGGSALDVVISATPPASTSGSFQWVQEITARNTQWLTPQNTLCSNCIFSGPGLDNVYPYPISLNYPTEAVDTPAVRLYSPSFPGLYELSDKFQAQMYLLWDPELNAYGASSPGCAASTTYITTNTVTVFSPIASTCAGSIPVPLGSMTWGYCGTAVSTLMEGANGWVLSCPANGTPDITQIYVLASGSSSYPTWTPVSVYLNH